MKIMSMDIITTQKAFRIFTVLNLILVVIMILSISMAWNAWTNKSTPRYYATQEDGRVVPLIAISRPFLNNGQIMNFAVQAITAALTMDYKNWRRDLTDASIHFQHPGGWNNFLEALENSGTLNSIIQRKLISNAVANNPVIIDNGFDSRGRYSWTVQIPLKITFESSNERKVDDNMAEVIVSQLPTSENSAALGITRVAIK